MSVRRRVLAEPVDGVHARVGEHRGGAVAPCRQPRAFGRRLAALVLAGEHATRQREVRHDRHAEPFARGDHFLFGRPVEQAVAVLHVHERRHAELLRRGRRFVEHLGREVRAADLAHLPRGDELGERFECVTDRRLRVGHVQQVEIDVVGAEPPQAVVDRLRDPFGAPSADTLGGAEAADLRGDDRLAAPIAEGATEEFLRLPAAVALGSVEVVHPGVETGVDDGARAVFVHTHAEVVATQAGNGDLERTNLAQLGHFSSSFRSSRSRVSPRYRCRAETALVASARSRPRRRRGRE